MEDTLRYFFSAMFQGFAAIITLGIMFYLYYLDKLSGKVDKIESKLNHFIPSFSDGDKYTFFAKEGLIKYIKKFVLLGKEGQAREGQAFEFPKLQIAVYDSIEEQKKSLSAKIKNLFKIARVILIVSLISLFLVGYYEWLNYTLLASGIFCIILSIIFFSQLFTFSKQIIDSPI